MTDHAIFLYSELIHQSGSSVAVAPGLRHKAASALGRRNVSGVDHLRGYVIPRHSTSSCETARGENVMD